MLFVLFCVAKDLLLEELVHVRRVRGMQEDDHALVWIIALDQAYHS